MNATQTIIPTDSTLAQIERREILARHVLEEIRKEFIGDPRTGPTFGPADASKLVHRTTSSIRMAESEGRLPEQARNEHGRREQYTLEQLDHMREVFGTRPWRDPADDPMIIAVQNFKGGVGKSTISIHLAQHLAIKGYRTLLVDADAQASSTMMFGYIPDIDLGVEDSIYHSLLHDDAECYRPLPELVRKTHYHNLDLIPANLHLYNAEYELAARMPSFGPSVMTRLRDELAKVANNYDVIILDPPPALGMISMSALFAANALVIPMPPNVIDFASTTSFLSMLRQNMEQMAELGVEADYKFIQIALTRSDENKQAQKELVEMARTVFGPTIMATEVKNSAEFDNATSQQQSVYDMSRSTTNHQVRKRCLTQLNGLNSEVERLIRSLWPNTPEID